MDVICYVLICSDIVLIVKATKVPGKTLSVWSTMSSFYFIWFSLALSNLIILLILRSSYMNIASTSN